jgi:hypothetical protein
MQEEIGHAETSASLTSHDPFNAPGFFVDNKVFDTCVGGTEGRVNGHPRRGEGPCSPNTGVCRGASTEGTTGPIACASNNFASGQLCEYADGLRPGGHQDGHARHKHQGQGRVPGELLRRQPVPERRPGLRRHRLPGDQLAERIAERPAIGAVRRPFMAGGAPYPQIQFETDAPGSEFLCNLAAQFNCVVPPLDARFYPFWTLTNVNGQGIGHGLFPAGACIRNFGNEYGNADFARFGGTATSTVRANPEMSGTCPALTMP